MLRIVLEDPCQIQSRKMHIYYYVHQALFITYQVLIQLVNIFVVFTSFIDSKSRLTQEQCV